MLERYARPAMKQLWTEDQKYNTWAQVERAHLTEQVNHQSAPPEVLAAFDKAIQSKTTADYLKREQETAHDVIAFIAEIGDAMGPLGAYLHKGLTSSDILDTALALRLVESLDLISKDVQKVLNHLKTRAIEHAQTICIGRTHGVHAEPMSFGHILAGYFAEFQRAQKRLQQAKQHIAVGKLSGAVGTYCFISLDFEEKVLQHLGLRPEILATQVIPRDRLVDVSQALLACALATERFAINMRHWGRTEVGEVLEPFGSKQKGSSAMPHKKNPILSENLSGLARTIRHYNNMLVENTILWHERDISHSSVERFALPDIFITCDFMLDRLASLIANMHIKPENMETNLHRTGGLWASSRVLTACVNKGWNRTEAYEWVQRIALDVSQKVGTPQGVSPQEFLNQLLTDPKTKEMNLEEDIRKAFDWNDYLESTPQIFAKVFGS